MGRGRCGSPQDAGPTSPPPNQPLSSGAAGGLQGTPEKPSLAVGAGGASNGTSLVVQRLRLCTSTAGGTGSIPGQGSRIPQAMQHSQKVK